MLVPFFCSHLFLERFRQPQGNAGRLAEHCNSGNARSGCPFSQNQGILCSPGFLCCSCSAQCLPVKSLFPLSWFSLRNLHPGTPNWVCLLPRCPSPFYDTSPLCPRVPLVSLCPPCVLCPRPLCVPCATYSFHPCCVLLFKGTCFHDVPRLFGSRSVLQTDGRLSGAALVSALSSVQSVEQTVEHHKAPVCAPLVCRWVL